MTNYTATGKPIDGTRGIAREVSGEFALIETAIATKANIVSPTFTGIPAAPTAIVGTNTTQIATTALVFATAVSATIPVISADNRKFLTNNGTIPSWGYVTNHQFNITNGII